MKIVQVAFVEQSSIRSFIFDCAAILYFIIAQVMYTSAYLG